MSDRFLEDHRRPLGGYDRIHFDEAEIIALRSRIDLDTSLRVHWEWDYLREVESLRALYERGKKAQWNVETDIDWSVEIPDTAFAMPCEQTVFGMVLRMMGAPEAMQMRAARDELAHGFSQLLHGEQAALQLTAQLCNMVPDMDAKLFAGQQVADECRHVEVFAKALARKFGEVHPIDPNIKFLLDEMLSTPNWHYKTIGMQVIFEGVAMGIITDMGTRTLNPLVRQIMRYVARDEARHAAFGVLALRDQIPKLSQRERDDAEDFTWRCLEVVANGLMTGLIDWVAPRYGLAPDVVAEAVFSNPPFWDGRYNMFNHTVLPNLRKLGIVTERTRPNYDRFRLWEKSAPFGAKPLPREEFYSGE